MLRALRDFLNSSATYEELYKNVSKTSTATLEIDGSWEAAVKEEIKNFSRTIGANIMSLFIDTSPKALIKVPNKAYPKDKSVEEFFLANFSGYFDHFKRELDCETFWNLLNRFLGNNGNHLSSFFFFFFLSTLLYSLFFILTSFHRKDQERRGDPQGSGPGQDVAQVQQRLGLV